MTNSSHSVRLDGFATIRNWSKNLFTKYIRQIQ